MWIGRPVVAWVDEVEGVRSFVEVLMTAWNAVTAVGAVGAGAVTVLEGSSFCVSAPNGDLDELAPHGVFFGDTRILSRWNLLVNNAPVQALGAVVREPYRAVFVGRSPYPAGVPDSVLVVERDRRVGTGVREDVVVRNFGRVPLELTVVLEVGADFADLFDVKGGRLAAGRPWVGSIDGDRVRFECRWAGAHRGVVIQAPGAVLTAERLSYRVVVAPRMQWRTAVLAWPVIDGVEVAASFPLGRPVEDSEPARRLLRWRAEAPVVSADDEQVAKTLRRSQRDLGSLRIFDPTRPDRVVVAAGSPWFMALFGRDSLLTSLMSLPIDQSLAVGVLQTLAEYQGTRVDVTTEEEPGRILHEVRLGVDAGRALGGGRVYYGTADATPLFVILLGELYRWGVDREVLGSLLPAADRALSWIGDFGDRDGDGFVEYARAGDHGLINQGWKDSWDGINFADGSLAEAPVALCEVQGYAYAAYLARAGIAQILGDRVGRDEWAGRAAELKRLFNDRFWMPDRGYYAVALDRDKHQVDACASNMGHCLWSGIVDRDKAAAVADRLLSAEMFSGWGVRTLATDMGAYNPVSYHNGSVWPHDNALVAAGLMRYGFAQEAQRIARGLFDAAEHFDGRLPELFCGFPRQDYREPIPYPTSCSPQAWAAATPVQLIRTLLRFDPQIPRGRLWVSPVLPTGFGRLHVQNVAVAGARLGVQVAPDGVTVTGLPPGVRLVQAPLPLPDSDPPQWVPDR